MTGKVVNMAERAAALAEQFEQAVAEFAETISPLSDEQWRAYCPGEARTVGVLARHVAQAIPFEMGVFREMTAGRQPPTLNMPDLAVINAASAMKWADCTKRETLALLRDHAATAAAEVRRWDDQQLARTGRYVDEIAEAWTVEQWIERILIGHIHDHLQSIRAGLVSA